MMKTLLMLIVMVDDVVASQDLSSLSFALSSSTKQDGDDVRISSSFFEHFALNRYLN